MITTEQRTIAISKQAAKTLLQLAQRAQMPSAQGKLLVGQAQAELEEALKEKEESKVG